MTRSVSATISTATAQETTRPIYLVSMGWATPVYAATWDQNISWNAITWIASGLNIPNLDGNGGTLELPLGDADSWLSLVLTEIPRGRTVSVYEYHTNFTVSPNVSDATLLFSGFMDNAQISNNIRIGMIEGATKKVFPPTWIDRPTYTYLLTPGTRIQWGDDTVIVN